MKRVEVTNHAVLRRYQRFNSNSEGMNSEFLRNEILSDFEKANLVIEYDTGINLYETTDVIYVVGEYEDKQVIVTTYPKVEEEIVKKYLINTKNVFVETKEDLEPTVMECLKNNDIVILKHFGRKKIVSIGNHLLLLTQEYEHAKTIFHVIKTWDVRTLNNFFILNSFKKEIFAQANRIEWEEFLVKLNLYKTVYNYKKHIKDSEIYINEIKTYKQVLIGELEEFPVDFWGKDNFTTAKLCVRYLIQDVLEWDYSDVADNFDNYTLQKYKLGEMVQILFNGNNISALFNAFPEKYQDCLFKKLPLRYK